MFGEGILSKAFITTFVETEAEDGEGSRMESWQTASLI